MAIPGANTWKASIWNAIVKSGLWRLPGVATASTLFWRITKSNSAGLVMTEFRNCKLLVDPKDLSVSLEVLFFKDYSGADAIEREVKPGMVIADVGANIGCLALIASKSVGDAGIVYAFEPQPRSYEILEMNSRLNMRRNVIPIKKAVSNKKGTTRLYSCEKHLGQSSLVEANVGSWTGYCEVETITLDDFFLGAHEGNSIPDLLIVDTQGAEGLVLEGADKLIRTRFPKMILEFCPYALRNFGTDPEQLLRRIEDYGYRIRYAKSGVATDASEVLRVMSVSNASTIGNYLDLIFEK